ncbi:uncharacterized protein LOC129639142 isoform X6 [Bubalus kerabau]|uniref:uncharacterized protein LOC129639142 isoform X6 n=1 Tax=Bubalus carabanensis TaxID=3119969 RepID=UPI00244EE8A8|nr:uncharacterized protein LOC129639142 isoform X6 [Bubalus carabanensis]
MFQDLAGDRQGPPSVAVKCLLCLQSSESQLRWISMMACTSLAADPGCQDAEVPRWLPERLVRRAETISSKPHEEIDDSRA